MSQASFAKRQREKERRERAAAKAERRAERAAAAAERPEAETLPPATEEALLAALADLHARFEAGDIEFEEFAEAKEQITEKLSAV